MSEEHDLIAGCKREEMWARKELYERYAVVYLLNKPKWNVYCSLGGMVEKGFEI